MCFYSLTKFSFAILNLGGKMIWIAGWFQLIHKAIMSHVRIPKTDRYKKKCSLFILKKHISKLL